MPISDLPVSVHTSRSHLELEARKEGHERHGQILMIDEEEKLSSAIVLHPCTAVLLMQLSRTMQTFLPSVLHDLQGAEDCRRGEERNPFTWLWSAGVDAAKALVNQEQLARWHYKEASGGAL